MIPFFPYSEKIKREKMITFNPSHDLCNQYAEHFVQFRTFEHNIQQLAEIMHLDLSQYEIDHIALRVNTEQSAKYWLTLLLKYGTILSDNLVNGRIIYLIKLDSPLLFLGQSIDVIELPFPKNKSYPVEGWEHIEIVIPFLPHETVEKWVARINHTFLWELSDNLNVKLSEPRVEGEQLLNPSIAVSFVDKQHNPTCIKVHPYHIKKIIEAE